MADKFELLQVCRETYKHSYDRHGEKLSAHETEEVCGNYMAKYRVVVRTVTITGGKPN